MRSTRPFAQPPSNPAVEAAIDPAVEAAIVGSIRKASVGRATVLRASCVVLVTHRRCGRHMIIVEMLVYSRGTRGWSRGALGYSPAMRQVHDLRAVSWRGPFRPGREQAVPQGEGGDPHRQEDVLGPNIPPRQVWRLRPPVDSPSRACLRSAGRPAGFFRRARSLVARVHACARSLLGCGLVRRRIGRCTLPGNVGGVVASRYLHRHASCHPYCACTHAGILCTETSNWRTGYSRAPMKMPRSSSSTSGCL